MDAILATYAKQMDQKTVRLRFCWLRWLLAAGFGGNLATAQWSDLKGSRSRRGNRGVAACAINYANGHGEHVV